MDWKILHSFFYGGNFYIDHKFHIVMENYFVYQTKLVQHSFSEIPTLRLIGAIDFIAFQYNVQVHYQKASEAKQFITDDKLKAWGLYDQCQRHSRDALRHVLYYILVSCRKEKK